MTDKRYQYSFEDEWSDVTDTILSDKGYHATAAILCEMRDHRLAEYPDDQEIWLLSEGHDMPRRFKVYAENIREYSAEEQT